MFKNNDVIRTSQVLRLGCSKSLLTKYVNAGHLVRSSHGVYTLPDSISDVMYELKFRSSKIVFSHETALFLNGFSERTPFQHAVTITSNTTPPISIKEECTCYYFKTGGLHGSLRPPPGLQ